MKEVRVIQAGRATIAGLTPVAAYCRVSSNSDDQLNSFSAQVKEYTSQIKANESWSLAGIYADEGITGTSAKKRPEFNRLIEDCRKGKIKRVLVKSISRFARNTQECLVYLRELKALGVSVYFEKENLDTAMISSEMMTALFSSLAQEESTSISSNMRRSYEQRMQSGEFITCFAPYGYRLKNGTLTIIEEEAAIVREIFNSYINGVSRTDIAKQLNQRSVSPRGGSGCWSAQLIKYILSNERYKGDALLQKRYTTLEVPSREKRNRGEKAQYYVEASHPAIVSAQTFDKAQRLCKSRSSSNGHIIYDDPLRCMIECAQCGSTFRRRVGNSGRVTWSCYKHDESKHLCSTPIIEGTSIHNSFIYAFNLIKGNIDYLLSPMITQLRQLEERSVAGNADINAFNDKIAFLSEQLRGVNRLYAKGYMEVETFREKSNAISTQLDDVKRKRSLLIENDIEDDTLSRTEELIDTIQEAPENLASLEDGEVFSRMVERVIVHPNKRIVFRLINGMELTGSEGFTNGEE